MKECDFLLNEAAILFTNSEAILFGMLSRNGHFVFSLLNNFKIMKNSTSIISLTYMKCVNTNKLFPVFCIPKIATLNLTLVVLSIS